MNLLQLIQQLCQELGLNVPVSVMASVDPQIVQMRALLSRHGHDLSRQFDWSRLSREYLVRTVSYARTGTVVSGSANIAIDTTGLSSNFTVIGAGIQPFAQVKTVVSSNQLTMSVPAVQSGTVSLTLSQTAYPLPADWLKQVPQTEWDRSGRWPILGPDSPQAWQAYKTGVVYVGPRERFRIQGGALQILPPPPNGLTFSYEYISSAWVNSADGTGKQMLGADTDTWVFDDSLMLSGLKLRWKQAKGLDFSFESAEYSGLLDMIKAQDHSAPILSLSNRRTNPELIGSQPTIAGRVGGAA